MHSSFAAPLALRKLTDDWSRLLAQSLAVTTRFAGFGPCHRMAAGRWTCASCSTAAKLWHIAPDELSDNLGTSLRGEWCEEINIYIWRADQKCAGVKWYAKTTNTPEQIWSESCCGISDDGSIAHRWVMTTLNYVFIARSHRRGRIYCLNTHCMVAAPVATSFVPTYKNFGSWQSPLNLKTFSFIWHNKADCTHACPSLTLAKKSCSYLKKKKWIDWLNSRSALL